MAADPTKLLTDAVTQLTTQIVKLNNYYDDLNSKAKRTSSMDDVPNPYVSNPSFTNFGSSSQGWGAFNPPAVTPAPGTTTPPSAQPKNAELAQPPQTNEWPFDPGAQEIRRQMLQQPGAISSSASVPSDAGGQEMVQSSAPQTPALNHNVPSPSQAWTWSMLGEHGGPAALRNYGLGLYGVQSSLQYAQNMSDALGNSSIGSAIPGLSTVTGAMSKGLGMAADNPMVPYAAYKSISGMKNNLSNYQDIGQSLGYGTQNIPLGQNIFGFQNPLGGLGTAAQSGASAELEASSLAGRVPGNGFGLFGNMSMSQANQTMQSLTSQGFGANPVNPLVSTLSSIPLIGQFLGGIAGGITGSKPTGDAATIANAFNKPMQNMYGKGIDPGTLAMFDPSFRNSATDIKSMVSALSNLGVESKATKETIEGFTQSVADVSQAFESMGSTPQGATAFATQYTNATGLDPQNALQMAQNPMMQGMLLGQYGILPSGIGDMSGGAFSNVATSVVKMLAGGLSGLNHNRYAMVDGHRVEIESGSTAVKDQIAQMTGMDSNVINRMLGDAKSNKGRSNLTELLGTQMAVSQGGGAGTFWAQLMSGNHPQQTEAFWNKNIEPHLAAAGLTPQEIKQLNAQKDMRHRANALAHDIANSSKNSPYNQISTTNQQRQNQMKVTIGLSGPAQKLFNLKGGPSGNKKSGNAGGTSITSIINSVPGDLSNPASTLGDLADTFGGLISGAASSIGQTFP